ncbi:sugar nucleotidyltransferase [Roseibacillus ishigakijimensis]|uniref:glucose-1-phosphate thymidylyltransferase n=1 Tax=Roseibacillus ishigakijimensis TaxID=454146 RepID=A0A934RT57_9BACT|nr:sugar phosphate nucleotidyltransferase [Roseibacillus ishigakijimensis]MBK1834973.1 NTP transferase domain-containing protein [Roseibacillus ishigakijimensis]
MIRKAVVLAGGKGTRLDPLTRVISKQLLPVYDKPMIFYPLSVVMRCGIRQVLVVTAPEWLASYQRLLGDGSSLGMSISYAVQERPTGVPDGLVIAADWLAGEGCLFILGDNLFFGNLDPLRDAVGLVAGATAFAIPTREPEKFGIVELDEEGRVLSLEEKPSQPRSDLALPGVYFFDPTVVAKAGALRPSSRGETEICELLGHYLCAGQLQCRRLGRGFVWLDAGTPEGLLKAGNFVATLTHRNGYELACLEEIAWREGWLSDEELASLAGQQHNPQRRVYLQSLIPNSPGPRL